jgi:hypothetical protein
MSDIIIRRIAAYVAVSAIALALVPMPAGAGAFQVAQASSPSPTPAPTVVDGVSLLSSAPSCAAPDVAVWIDAAKNAMTPLTATTAGQGSGGYYCAAKFKAAAPGKFGLTSWTGPSGAQCGSGQVVAFDPKASSPNAYESRAPQFTQAGMLYTCETMLVALGASVTVNPPQFPSTIPTCTAGDVAVMVGGGYMMPATASNADWTSLNSGPILGYTCASNALKLKYTIGSFPQPQLPDQPHCGNGVVVGYSGTTYYERSAPSFGAVGYYTCEALAKELGWTMWVPPPLPAAPTCSGGDVAVWVAAAPTTGKKYMFPLTDVSTIRNSTGGYGCARQAQTAGATVENYPTAGSAPCGSDSVVSFTPSGTPGLYYDSSSSNYKSGWYECQTLLTALGWKLYVAPQPVGAPGACPAGDVPVWLWVLAKQMLAPTATDFIAPGAGTWGCARQAKANGYAVHVFYVPSDAKCGSDKVVAYATFYNPAVSAYFESGSPGYQLPGNTFQCESLLAALGYVLETTAPTPQPAPTPTVNPGAPALVLLSAPPSCPNTVRYGNNFYPYNSPVWVNTVLKVMYGASNAQYGVKFVPGDSYFGYTCAVIASEHGYVNGTWQLTAAPSWASKTAPTTCKDRVVWIDAPLKLYIAQGKPGFGVAFPSFPADDYGYACKGDATKNGYNEYPG